MISVKLVSKTKVPDLPTKQKNLKIGYAALWFEKYKFSLFELPIKLVDSLNMTNRAQIHAFYKRLNTEILHFQATVFKSGDLFGVWRLANKVTNGKFQLIFQNYAY